MFTDLNNIDRSTLPFYETYPDGRLQHCILNRPVLVNSGPGALIPQYEHAGIRKKHTYSVSFFESGVISRISLNEQTAIATPIGSIPAELIIFYESGSLKRVFPLNGQISGYWEETDEYSLAEELSIPLAGQSIKAKVISAGFFENGEISDLTFWPGQRIKLRTPAGEQLIKTGMTFYPGGAISSFEPAAPILVETPIGFLTAYDTTASGISGNKNSLIFCKAGTVKSIITSNEKVTVSSARGYRKVYTPLTGFNFFKPLKISFENGKVSFNNEITYDLDEYDFSIAEFAMSGHRNCADCSNCNQRCD